MRIVKVAAGVLNQTPLDWDGNRDNILEAICQARTERVSILCLPELCIPGYGCEDAFLSSNVQRMSLQVLEEIVPQTQGIILALGLPLLHSGRLYDVACLVCDGEVLGFVGKQHLAGEGIHYEPRWFHRWPSGLRSRIEIGRRQYPLGDWLFDCGGIRVGFEICEDAWVSARPGAHLAARGADIILNPSASHFAFGKHLVRRRFVLEGSRAFGVCYVYANLVGNEAGRAIYDGDAMIASTGEMLATGPRLGYEACRLTTATIDIDQIRMKHTQRDTPEPDRAEREATVFARFEFPDAAMETTPSVGRAWEHSSDIKFEEFTRAVSLGLFDYLRKSRSRGFVISLSGGVDSSSVAVLCWLMIRLAGECLTLERLVDQLGRCSAMKLVADSAQQLARQLITTVYQSTCNSSDLTRQAARTVAQAIGARHLEWDVDPIVQQYTRLVAGTLPRQLSWQTDNLALQNIQARARSPGVWMIANLTGALLLTTSNRSEAAVGYATMDGDTSGGLAPIAGIDKAFLQRWLKWMQCRGPDGVGPIPQLECVNAQQPTAELRPQEDRQTDEGDLMPYDLLDVIQRLAIGEKLSPLEVFRHLQGKFPQYDACQLCIWTEKFFHLWCRNQWKRERYAPSFHLDDQNLDPKTWCRFPILSGGFDREFDELRQYVAEHQHRQPTAGE